MDESLAEPYPRGPSVISICARRRNRLVRSAALLRISYSATDEAPQCYGRANGRQ